MDDRYREFLPELEEQWRDWSQSDPALDEAQLRRNLLMRIGDRGPRRRVRLVLVAASAALLAVLIGLESTRRPADLATVEEAKLVHETANNVILVLREAKAPIYVLTESTVNGEGERP